MLSSLTKIIANRPVAVLLPGPSIKNFKKGKYCYATVNHYWLFEEAFDVKFEIVLAAAVENTESIVRYFEFSKRDNVAFITTDALGLEGIKFKTDEPNIVRKIPTEEEPLSFRALPSFALLILLLTIAGAKKIILFGADGGEVEGEPLYWGEWPSASRGRIDMDTRILNQAFPIILRRVCKLYGIDKPEIKNMSPKSHYTCF